MASRMVRWLLIAALVTGYPFLAHYTNQSPRNASLGALVAITPLFLLALIFTWRSPRRIIMLGLILLACFAMWAGWSLLEQHYGLIYWLQHVCMQLVLLIVFGRTLIPGRQPLCTVFAEAIHGSLTVQHAHYAYQVTVAWTLFFAVMALTSTLLFFMAPLTLWSVFANFLTLPLVALMMIAEYWVRRWALPDIRRIHILEAIQAFRNTSARQRILPPT